MAEESVRVCDEMKKEFEEEMREITTLRNKVRGTACW